MDTRYNRVSTIITTNLDTPEWYDLFQKKPMVDALLDRLQHHCITIRIDGPTLRNDPPAATAPATKEPARPPRRRYRATSHVSHPKKWRTRRCRVRRSPPPLPRRLRAAHPTPPGNPTRPRSIQHCCAQHGAHNRALAGSNPVSKSGSVLMSAMAPATLPSMCLQVMLATSFIG